MKKNIWYMLMMLLIAGSVEAYAKDALKDVNGCEVSFLNKEHNGSGYELNWKLDRDGYWNGIISSYDEIKQLKWQGTCKAGMAHDAGSLIVDVKKNGWGQRGDVKTFTFDGTMYKGRFRGPVAGGYFYNSTNKNINYLYDDENFGQDEDKFKAHVQNALKEHNKKTAMLATLVKPYVNDNLQQELGTQPEIACSVLDADISGSYRGGCKNGKANGIGMAKGRDTYIGEFIDGKQHGQGTYYWNQSIQFYKGGWVAGKASGKGIFVWTNGNRYEGDFVEDTRVGKGTFVWAIGDRYEGDFKDDEMQGQGKLTWNNGDIYQGMFAKGSRTGTGTIKWANGDRYEGDFVADKRTGRGTFVWANGYRYEGDYIDNKRVLSEKDKYLDIEEPFIQDWVLNNLVSEKELPPGKWYPTDNGKIFMSDALLDGYRFSNPTWSGGQRNGYANGPGTLKYDTTKFVSITVKVDCYMLNGSIFGMAVFSDATNRSMIQTKTVYLANNKVMKEDEYKDFIISRYKLGMAAEKAKDKRFTIRHAFKHGTIGTRYVPVTSNEIYNTETLFNVGNTPVTRTSSWTETKGGNNEKVDGYTAVIGITNNTKEYYIVKTLIGGTHATSEYYKHNTFLWFGKEEASLSAKMKYLTISKSYLLKPGEGIKDQIVVGEKEPADFQIGFSDIIPIDEAWVSGLDNIFVTPVNNCSNAKKIISNTNRYLSDSKASAWHGKLTDKKLSSIKYIDHINVDLLRKFITAAVQVPDNYDRDFENDVEITVSNSSDNNLKVIITDPMQQQQSVTLKPKTSDKIVSKVRGMDKAEIGAKVGGIRLVDNNGAEKDFDTCPAEKTPPQPITAQTAPVDPPGEQSTPKKPSSKTKNQKKK